MPTSKAQGVIHVGRSTRYESHAKKGGRGERKTIMIRTSMRPLSLRSLFLLSLSSSALAWTEDASACAASSSSALASLSLRLIKVAAMRPHGSAPRSPGRLRELARPGASEISTSFLSQVSTTVVGVEELGVACPQASLWLPPSVSSCPCCCSTRGCPKRSL